MDLKSHLRTLAMASMLGIAVMSLPAVHVFAEPIGGAGEAAVCYYDGKAYSEGATYTEPDGTVHTCQHDGTWSFAGAEIAGVQTLLPTLPGTSDLPQPVRTPAPRFPVKFAPGS